MRSPQADPDHSDHLCDVDNPVRHHAGDPRRAHGRPRLQLPPVLRRQAGHHPPLGPRPPGLPPVLPLDRGHVLGRLAELLLPEPAGVGLMLLMVFGVFLQILPSSGVIDIRVTGAPFLTPEYNQWFSQNPVTGVLDVAKHIILPATTLAIVGVAADSRFVRASMLDAIHQDFVRTARAKGVPERTVILKHTLRNALLPVITNIALELPILFSGAVVTERIFTWPGMGQLFFQALEGYDYPLMMGILFVAGLLVIFFNVLADFAYAIADPRISYA
ncbi:MAG: ABC transporter permease [Chloroflexi bacterium]|nr:MAG: ABC transporter permease [Chloroflexota bacterium]